VKISLLPSSNTTYHIISIPHMDQVHPHFHFKCEILYDKLYIHANKLVHTHMNLKGTYMWRCVQWNWTRLQKETWQIYTLRFYTSYRLDQAKTISLQQLSEKNVRCMYVALAPCQAPQSRQTRRFLNWRRKTSIPQGDERLQ